ncbi:MAG: DUF4388 domain-containing protein [Polyangiaceae bacterium]
MEAHSVPFDLEIVDLPEEPRGFSASLNAASLSDLVQLQCLSGNACVARITAGDEVGYLYFRGGRVVHAVSATFMGEAAALEILAWDSGSFEICNAGWPDNESIQASYQSLLLRAAQTRDESGRDNLLRFPGTLNKPLSSPPRRALPSESDETAPQSGAAQVRAAVRLDPNGEVILRKGSGAEDLADATALTLRLSRLIGEGLGLEHLLCVECTSVAQRTLVLVEKDGGALCVRAPIDIDLSALRARYGV